MIAGTPIDRQWLGVLSDGTIVLEWSDGTAVDMVTNEFIKLKPGQWTHAVQDDDLETLRRMGRIGGYDERRVYVLSLPEKPPDK